MPDGGLHVIANNRQAGDAAEYALKEREQRGINPIPARRRRALPRDHRAATPPTSPEVLEVRGVEVDGFRVLRADSPAVPNAIAAVLLRLATATGVRPTAYFEWAEGNPLGHLLRYLLFGEGDTAPVTRESCARPSPTREAPGHPRRRLEREWQSLDSRRCDAPGPVRRRPSGVSATRSTPTPGRWTSLRTTAAPQSGTGTSGGSSASRQGRGAGDQAGHHRATSPSGPGCPRAPSPTRSTASPGCRRRPASASSARRRDRLAPEQRRPRPVGGPRRRPRAGPGPAGPHTRHRAVLHGADQSASRPNPPPARTR